MKSDDPNIKVNRYIRGIDYKKWNEIKAEAALRGTTIAQVIESAWQSYAADRDKAWGNYKERGAGMDENK